MRHPLALMIVAPALLAGSPNSEMLVSTEWLAAHASDPALVILHVSGDRKIYQQEHIPGARFLAWSELGVTRDGIPEELPPTADLVRLLEACGVRNNSRIVVYGDQVLFAARAFFTLDYLGFGARTSLLDGGLGKWKAEQRPLSQSEPAPAKGELKPNLRPDAVIGIAELRAASDLAVIDTRSPADYAGEAANANLPRRGHIRGARNIFWRDLMTSGSAPVFRPREELSKIAAVPAGKTAVVYCVAGVQAAVNYFVLRYLDQPVRLYDGSLWEWSRSDAPMEP